MTTVRLFTPENRLAGVIGGPDDPSYAALVRDAEAGVASLGPKIRQAVKVHQRAIAKLCAAPEEEVFADCQAVGGAALEIADIAGAAGMEAAGEAARGLYAMTNALIAQGVWHTEALQLHVAALAVLTCETPPSSSEAIQVLKRLKAMREWCGIAD